MAQLPTSPAAPLHEPEPPLHPDEDEREPPFRVVLFGVPLQHVVLALAVAGGALYGVGRFISLSQSEVDRAGREIAPAMQRQR